MAPNLMPSKGRAPTRVAVIPGVRVRDRVRVRVRLLVDLVGQVRVRVRVRVGWLELAG